MDKTTKINIFKNRNFNLLFAGVMVSNIAHVLYIKLLDQAYRYDRLSRRQYL